MDTFIGLLELTAWIVAVTSIAAALTALMIRLTPNRADKDDEAVEASESDS